MSLIPGVGGGEETTYHSDTPPTNINSENSTCKVEDAEDKLKRHESRREVIRYYSIGFIVFSFFLN